MTKLVSLTEMFGLPAGTTQAQFDTFLQQYFAEQNDTRDAEVARHDRALFRRGR